MNFKFDDALVYKYSDMVKQIASEYAKKYRMVDVADISQEIWMWFVTHDRKLSNWNEEYESEKEIDKLVARSLRNAAYDFCIREKAEIEGYSLSDVFFYRKDFIKMLLPAVVSNDWTKLQNKLSLGGRSLGAPAESNDWMAYMADIRKALQSLSEKDRELVIQFYGNDIDGAELHENIAPEKSTARAAMMQANRALNKMVKVLGGNPPFKDKEDDDLR